MFFENLKIHHKNIIYQKNLIFETKFYTFKVAIFHENSPCFKSPFICLKQSRKVGGPVVFLYQNSFSFIKCSPNCFIFFVKFNIFHKKGSVCSKHSKNINTYTLEEKWAFRLVQCDYFFPRQLIFVPCKKNTSCFG